MKLFKLNLPLCIGVIFSTNLCFYSQENTFSKTYYSYSFQIEPGGVIPITEGFTHDMIQLPDGGFVVTGAKKPQYSPSTICSTDLYVLRTDSFGNELWKRGFGGFNCEEGRGVCLTPDNFLMVTGCVNCGSYGPNDSQSWLLKLNMDGDTVWSKQYGGTEREWFNAVCMATDGGYIMAGRTNSWGQGSADMWFVKTDTDGNIVWDRTFDVLGEAWANDILPTADGGYIVAGSMCAGLCNQSVLVKLDQNGDVEWSEQYPALGSSNGFSVKQNFDLGYVFTGFTDQYMRTVRTNQFGTVIWEKIDSIPGNILWGSSIDISSVDQSILVTGMNIFPYETFGPLGHSTAYVTKLDQNGSRIWTNEYGGDTELFGGMLGHEGVFTSDGGTAIAAVTSNIAFSDKRGLVLIKTNQYGMTEPVANFKIRHPGLGCDSTEIRFETYNMIGSYDTLHWDFGDGDFATGFNPTHTYNSTGAFLPSLIVNNPLGSDTIVMQDSIRIFNSATYPITQANFTAIDTILYLPNATAQIINHSTGQDFGIDWDDPSTFGIDVVSTPYPVIDLNDTMTHTYWNTGDYRLILFASGFCSPDGNLSSTYVEDTIIIHVYPEDPLNSLEELNKNEQHLKLFPNPNNGNFKLSGKITSANSSLEVMIYDAKGFQMKQMALKSDANRAYQAEIHVSDLSTGIYFLKVVSKDEIQMKRINIVR